MASGDLLKLVVNQSLQSSVVQNVLYYEVITDAPSDPNEVELANVFTQSVIVAKWQPVVTTELGFECLQIQKEFPTPAAAVREFDVSLVGQKAPEALPAMNSVLFQKINNATAGVGRRGRIYVAGIPESDTKLGRIINDAKAALEDLAALFEEELAAPSSGVYKPAWATRDKTTPFAINGFVPIDVVTLLPRIATQRRRRTPIASFTV